MEALTELHSNVHQLTREHTRRHNSSYRVDGQLVHEEVHGTVPSLLDQLRKCIGASAGGNTGGASTSAGLPLDVASLNLLEEIRGKCRERYLTAGNGVTQVPAGDVEGNLRRWVANILTDEKSIEDARRATAGWVSAILAIISPQRSTEIVGACPACGWSKQEVIVDGETKICSVLIAVGGTVTCQSCGTDWEGEQLYWLRDAMEAKTQENAEADVLA